MPMKKPTPRAKAFVKAMALKLAIPHPCEIAGSIRREDDPVGDIDLVVTVPDLDHEEHHARNILADTLEDYINTTPQRQRRGVVVGGRSRFAHATHEGYAINLWCGTPEEAGALLFAATGPKTYNIWYRSKARRAGFLLNEKGLWVDDRRVAGADECSIYTALGKPWKEPRLRGKQLPMAFSQGKGIIIDDRTK
jgi:DNA polymerase (family 10)